jgi:N6-adenosine-specific RNA methylase IME4/ParB-like chromosome segregation protein Spo0J
MGMLIVDEELKKLIPPLTVEEFEQLEKSILEEGIREPIVTWWHEQEEEIIIDGHNRYEIAEKYELHYNTVLKEFDSREEVIEWMILNQFGRRNLSAYQRSLLALKLKPVFEEKAEKNLHLSQGQGIKGCQISDKVNVDTKKELAKVAGVSHDTIVKVQKIEEKASKEVKEKLQNGQISINKAYNDIKREAKKEELQKLEPPKGKYRVIYTDPPWSYGDKKAPSSGGCEDHYTTMSISEICEMPIKELADDNAVLFLWVTSPLIQEGLEVIKAWGFVYKAMFVWDKIKHNIGHYNSVRHELLLLATKGSCLPDENKLYDSVQSIERSNTHSEKPEEFRNIIDSLYKYGNKIELFARKKVDGWEVWGNQV